MQVDIQDGVMFLTYASLASSSDAGLTRLDQLVAWCGEGFEGLIVFDESHKAKNLVPDSGAKPSKVGAKVPELQTRLPKARIVYCSATGEICTISFPCRSLCSIASHTAAGCSRRSYGAYGLPCS